MTTLYVAEKALDMSIEQVIKLPKSYQVLTVRNGAFAVPPQHRINTPQILMLYYTHEGDTEDLIEVKFLCVPQPDDTTPIKLQDVSHELEYIDSMLIDGEMYHIAMEPIEVPKEGEA